MPTYSRLFQLIRRHQRHVTKIVRSVKDEYSFIQTSPAGVASTFVTFFEEKFRHVNVDPNVLSSPIWSVLSDRLVPSLTMNTHSP